MPWNARKWNTARGRQQKRNVRFVSDAIAGERCILCSDAMHARVGIQTDHTDRRIDRRTSLRCNCTRLVILFLTFLIASSSFCSIGVSEEPRRWLAIETKNRLSFTLQAHTCAFLSRKETIKLCDEKNQVSRSFATLEIRSRKKLYSCEMIKTDFFLLAYIYADWSKRKRSRKKAQNPFCAHVFINVRVVCVTSVRPRLINNFILAACCTHALL